MIEKIPFYYIKSLRVRGTLPKSHIYLIWHRYLIGGMAIFRDKGFYGLVTNHKDGRLAASVMKQLGIKPLFVSEEGKATKDTILKIVKGNVPVIITMDGPKGPPFQDKGIVDLLNRYNIEYSFIDIKMLGMHLNTWDRLLLPYPYGKISFRVNKVMKSEK